VKDDRTYLLHMLDAIAQLERHAGTGKERFLAERTIQDAVIRNFEVLGQAVKNMSAALRSANPVVPWKTIAGMRDKLAHEYFGVNLPLLWDVLETQLIPLRTAIQHILSELS
jgi:uncharacterized protein with HEPN domain